MTPFLLGEINQVTQGESLKANQHLIENNVTVASAIALELAKLKKKERGNSSSSSLLSSGSGLGTYIPCILDTRCVYKKFLHQYQYQREAFIAMYIHYSFNLFISRSSRNKS